jgi:pSer/pThr/pTyr-binding forkhead associated (FHA) protein
MRVMGEPVEENTEVVEARRLGCPVLVYADGADRQRVISLLDDWNSITIGRGMGADLVVAWDEGVSRLHCQLERLADSWVVVDDGLSANGTYVNGERIERRRRLFDGDELRVGATSVLFRAPFEAPDVTAVEQMPDSGT